jgi:hypothetical protein
MRVMAANKGAKAPMGMVIAVYVRASMLRFRPRPTRMDGSQIPHEYRNVSIKKFSGLLF